MSENPLTNAMIGVRFVETLDRVKFIASYEDKLDDPEREFIADLLERLEKYKERAYVSVKQLNWLNRIEDKCVDL